MNDYNKIATDIWADFDAIINIESISSDVNIPNKVNAIKRVSSACVHQVVSVLHELRYNTDSRKLKKTIEESHKYWSSLQQEILNL